MENLYVIGGSPCSGKSSIAERLAAAYDLTYYKLDDYLEPYMTQAAQDGRPYSLASSKLDFEQTFLRDPQLQCDEEFAIYEEMLPYALRAIRALPGGRPILAEGAGFTPGLMARLGVAPARYACLVPTEAFQREHYARRGWMDSLLAGCREPAAVYENWMQRDALFAQEALRQAKRQGYFSLVVDGKRSLRENCEAVARVFEFLPGGAPAP